ncbi:MAG: DUF493 domain-containing protein, partial [candidate division Zixibacteria bacterium]|nr:DUF493 domain-containing protein [candidate division Zixibacteria bacterium]
MKRTLYLLAAGLMVSVIIIGCSTEDPYVVDAENPLVMAMVSAPDATTAVASNSSVSFSWSATGGSGEMAGYRWYLDPMETGYNTATNVTNVTYENVPGDAADPTDYTFRVIGTDSDGDADTIVAAFIVSATVDPDPDVTAPVVTITSGPAEGSYVATGTSIAFSWTGDDGGGNDDMIEYQYAFPTVGDVSDWGPATSASFNEVAAVDPAEFRVRGRDQDDNTSDWVLVSFVIQDATILYIDDYLFTDADGNNDMPKERDQKQFYRDALAGYAFAEWDNDVSGTPELADIPAGVEVIVWCADSEIGTADGNYRLWYDIGAEGGGVLKEFMDAGGKVLLTGTQTLGYMYDSNPPASDAFESEYLGVSDSLI